MLRSYLHQHHIDPEEQGPVRLLAIDTSADRAGVALMIDDDLHDFSWPAARSQSTQVLPRIQQLLDVAGLATAELSAVAVAIGPGTFTGLRVGVSLAKGLALAHYIPIIGVPTLVATALPWLESGVPVMAVLPAGRGRLVWQRFRADALNEDEIQPPVNGTPEELLAVLPDAGVQAVVGELPEGLARSLVDAPVPVVAVAGLTSRVGAVAQLGHHAWRVGDVADLATLEPIYVHGTAKVARPVRDARL